MTSSCYFVNSTYRNFYRALADIANKLEICNLKSLACVFFRPVGVTISYCGAFNGVGSVGIDERKIRRAAEGPRLDAAAVPAGAEDALQSPWKLVSFWFEGVGSMRFFRHADQLACVRESDRGMLANYSTGCFVLKAFSPTRRHTFIHINYAINYSYGIGVRRHFYQPASWQ